MTCGNGRSALPTTEIASRHFAALHRVSGGRVPNMCPNHRVRRRFCPSCRLAPTGPPPPRQGGAPDGRTTLPGRGRSGGLLVRDGPAPWCGWGACPVCRGPGAAPLAAGGIPSVLSGSRGGALAAGGLFRVLRAGGRKPPEASSSACGARRSGQLQLGGVGLVGLVVLVVVLVVVVVGLVAQLAAAGDGRAAPDCFSPPPGPASAPCACAKAPAG